MTYDRPLMAWLSGHKFYQKSPFYIINEEFILQSAWVAIDQQVMLHEAAKVELRPFDATWNETLAYIALACEKLGRNMPGWAPDKLTADAILEEIGLPPLRCYALYFLTVEDSYDERCVYVGQTNSKQHRFRSGHAAISKLHHPKYDGLTKRLYLAGIQVEDDDDHSFPVEWVHPLELRQQVLESVEKRLIFDLQPELNTKEKKSFDAHFNLPINVQNLSSKFLDAIYFGP